jgi:signal transduction histidine kinase
MAAITGTSHHTVPRPKLVDAVVAALFLVCSPIDIAFTDVDAPVAAGVVAVLVPSLGLAWRSVAPVAAAIVITGGYTLATLLGWPPEDGSAFPVLALVLAIYSVGAHANLRGTLAVVALGVVPMVIAVAATGSDEGDVGVHALAPAIALLVGRAVRVMGFEVDELEARNVALARERDERARVAVAAERALIARELHDVIGHSVSLMGVQAGAVRRRLEPEQDREREVLLAVERTGRDAVAELHRLLGFLRDDGTGAPGALPTLRRIDDLVGEMTRAGLDVELSVSGELDDVPPGRALAAFRILQEALTNVLRHAPRAHVEVRLRRTADELAISVVDDGAHAGSATTNGDGGHGLVGMRERVALYDGTLDAGPRDEQGFAVEARLPFA